MLPTGHSALRLIAIACSCDPCGQVYGAPVTPKSCRVALVCGTVGALKPRPYEPRNSRLRLGCQRPDNLPVVALPKSEYLSWRNAPVISKPCATGATASAKTAVNVRSA